MAKKERDGEVKNPRQKYLIALVSVCVVFAVGGYLLARYTDSDRSPLAIYSVIAAAAAWSVFFFLFDLKKDKTKSMITAMALFLSMVAATQIGYALRIADIEQKFLEKKQADEAAAAARALALKNAAKAVDPATEKAADVVEYERFENAFINQNEVLRNEYQHALDVSGWNKFFDSDRLKADKTLADSKAILQKARDTVVKYRAQNLAMLTDALKDIAALKLSAAGRQKVQAVFDSTGPYSAAAISAQWDCMDRQITEYEGIVTLLSNKKIQWAPHNGKVLFTEQRDLDVFNANLASARDASKKEDEIRETLRNALDTPFAAPKPAAAPGAAPGPTDAKPGDAKPGDAKAADQKTDAPKPESVPVVLPKTDTSKK